MTLNLLFLGQGSLLTQVVQIEMNFTSHAGRDPSINQKYSCNADNGLAP